MSLPLITLPTNRPSDSAKFPPEPPFALTGQLEYTWKMEPYGVSIQKDNSDPSKPTWTLVLLGRQIGSQDFHECAYVIFDAGNPSVMINTVCGLLEDRIRKMVMEDAVKRMNEKFAFDFNGAVRIKLNEDLSVDWEQTRSCMAAPDTFDDIPLEFRLSRQDGPNLALEMQKQRDAARAAGPSDGPTPMDLGCKM